jgi:hypothetical protein
METPWILALRGWSDGDHAMKHEMEIKCEEKAISYHIIHACDVNSFHASYFA